ncbi:hypothetical protein VS_II0615 [Vibrio atlanticus]|uniref:Uncharacterized protein n=1 Tax=Vibrio atlanticus (strain LGP32) TaxID=575788 RepID=B7VRM7_VIBA3|nr:hypothetical protein VS_II0615 [Vibrio atlanticus]
MGRGASMTAPSDPIVPPPQYLYAQAAAAVSTLQLFYLKVNKQNNVTSYLSKWV